MKKIIIARHGHRGRSGYNNLVLADSPSVIDLPSQVAEVLIDNDAITFKVISWCMFPVIWAGDVLKICPVSPQDAKAGDIVLYKTAGRAFAHRLIKTYKEKDRLFVAVSDEKGYRHNRFGNPRGYDGIPADSILGKVIEIKRGKLHFKPDSVKLDFGSLVKGRLKLSLWILRCKIEQYAAGIFKKLQGIRSYRLLFRKLINNKISFFVGIPFASNAEEGANFRFYRKFDEFCGHWDKNPGEYHILAKVNERPAGNIGLFFDARNPSCKTCILYNLIVRTPFRGGGIGCQLLEKALYLCDRIGAGEIKVNLSEEDKAGRGLFLKLGFEVEREKPDAGDDA